MGVDLPGITWAVTFACPLRCVHCYTESGRRPARQLGPADMLRVTDALISMRPPEIAIAGGEPLLVKGIYDLARKITAAGISAAVWTSGWTFHQAMVDELVGSFTRVHVSLDGATAEVHDRIRARKGSYDKVMAALAMLDGAARHRPVHFGFDCVVTRSNFDQLERFCAEVAPRFPRLGFISFGAALPIGLASRDSFAAHELLTDEQAEILVGDELRDRLRSIAPPTVHVATADHRSAHPYLSPQTPVPAFMEIEPDGGVRSFPYYEGIVGNILAEPGDVLWQKALARARDPFVLEAFSSVRTIRDWAAAVRRIDYHFGSAQVRARIDGRPEFSPV
ncbi:radical SAM protein [Fodinicola acaciae]|uniref:radical SAM protein n=1 Tax=Fodinicola acaciae TaxID=2681555 RepID=UPI0013D8A7E0|nr:radical SAM protein [Fodinicola acaciae]